jgi:hypothetical protein
MKFYRKSRLSRFFVIFATFHVAIRSLLPPILDLPKPFLAHFVRHASLYLLPTSKPIFIREMFLTTDKNVNFVKPGQL